MNVERINPAELARPSGFSHAVAVTGGRTVFLAGQTGMDRDGTVVAGGVVAQFEQALANLLTALAAAGGAARPPRRPPMAGVGVTRLWDPDALIEIQGIAALSP